MSNANLPQDEKTRILEKAVINETPEEVGRIFKELGAVDMNARALGIACRFCGVEAVKALVEEGATFNIPNDVEIEQQYHCYSGAKYESYDNYRTNYALYLLNISRHIKGAVCCKGLLMRVKAERDGKPALKQLPDIERAKVLKYLYDNKDFISFNPSEFLYYAIFAQDGFIIAELEKLGVKLSDRRIKIITNGGPISDSYWYEWTGMMFNLGDENFLPVMERIKKELGGKPFHCSPKVYDITKKRFVNDKILDFFCANFTTNKLNKTQLLRELIDTNAVKSLSIAEKLGFLDDPVRRDKIIQYAQQKTDNVECLAFLLDFKNRTADFATEREKAEKKARRELNADPNTVTALKKIWSFKKITDDTLIITSYRGMSTNVIVPQMIGTSTVTAIGRLAFSPASPRLTPEQQEFRKKITSITLPNSIRSIGGNAFYKCMALTDIVIPDSVVEIKYGAFAQCVNLTEIVIPDSVKKFDHSVFSGCTSLRSVTLPKGITEIIMQMFQQAKSLKTITLPDGVKKIGERAFRKCSSLEEIVIPTGTTVIGGQAFADCPSLKTVVIPASVTEIQNDKYMGGTLMLNIFDGSPNVTAIVNPGSFAEEYCKSNIIAYRYKD